MATIELTREWWDGSTCYGGAHAKYNIEARIDYVGGVQSVVLSVRRIAADPRDSDLNYGTGANALFLFALVDPLTSGRYWKRLGTKNSTSDDAFQFSTTDHGAILADARKAFADTSYNQSHTNEICGMIIPEDSDDGSQIWGVGGTEVEFSRPVSLCTWVDGSYQWPPLVSAANRFWNYGDDPLTEDSFNNPCSQGDRLIEVYPFSSGSGGLQPGDDPVDPTDFDYFPGATYRTNGGLWISHNRGTSSGHGAGRAAIRKNGAWLDELNKSLSLDVSLNKGIIRSNAWTRQELIGLYKDTR